MADRKTIAQQTAVAPVEHIPPAFRPRAYITLTRTVTSCPTIPSKPAPW